MATIKSFTDLQQSKKLAEILPLESADMYYSRQIDFDYFPPDVESFYPTPFYKDNKEDFNYDIPCWSLAALLNTIPSGQVNRMADSDKWEASSWNDSDFEPVYYVEDCDNPVDACVVMIEKLNELNLL